MILKSLKTRLGLTNLLADFILNKIPSHELSIIQVVDCKNLLIVKGETSSDEILEMSKIIEEFREKYSEILQDTKLTNVIDIIEYDLKLNPTEKIIHSFHNTESCSYNFSQIENYKNDDSKNYLDNYFSTEMEEPLVVCSSFPHGHSLKMGRSLYYLGKHIVYNIPSTSPFTKVTLTIDKNPESFKVFDDFYKTYDEKLISAILDCVNYNTNWIETEMKKVDFCIETTNPLFEHDFIKKIYKEFIII